MANKTMKLALKASAPDEITVQIGIELDRTFKKKDAPFQVDRTVGEAILRSYDDFTEFSEGTTAKQPATRKSRSKTAAKTATTKTAAAKTVKPDDDGTEPEAKDKSSVETAANAAEVETGAQADNEAGGE